VSGPRPPIPTEDELLEYVRGQRWFAAPRDTEPSGLALIDTGELRSSAPRLLDVLAEVRFGSGARDVYQLLLGADDGPGARAADGPGVQEALSQPSTALELIALAAAGATVPTAEGAIEFCAPQGRAPEAASGAVSAIGVEQTNSSVVVDDALIVKLYRRLEAGVNPELELLRFLGAHGFDNAPALRGWWSYTGPALGATLGMLQQFLPGAVDGWRLALDELPVSPQTFLERVDRLGEVVGEMHLVLASAPDDPVFAPEEASNETLALLAATVDDEIAEVFDHLPDDEAVAPIAGQGDAVRELLLSRGTPGSVGELIRHHGDLHLGQVLWAGGDWYVVDFEGEPARTLTERRAKRSPLRDVAGMLRSLTYAVTVAAPAEAGIENRVREAFLRSYLAAVEPAQILPALDRIERLISIFELEKAVYELRYELAHRPDWVHVPVAGIRSLLDRPAA
jgi:maltokinase